MSCATASTLRIASSSRFSPKPIFRRMASWSSKWLSRRRSSRAISEAMPALRMSRSSPEAIALARANWLGVLDPADGAVARHGRVDEAGFPLQNLPAGRVDAALGRVGVELDLVVFVALPLDPALALFDLRGQPRNVEMVEGFQAPLGIDAAPHGLG
jgi:hypothetical protein